MSAASVWLEVYKESPGTSAGFRILCIPVDACPVFSDSVYDTIVSMAVRCPIAPDIEDCGTKLTFLSGGRYSASCCESPVSLLRKPRSQTPHPKGGVSSCGFARQLCAKPASQRWCAALRVCVHLHSKPSNFHM